MNYTTVIESLSNFNERVLIEGTLNNNEIYGLESIKNKIFFNSIFMSNMKEVFQKYTISEIVEIIPNYINDLKLYNKNIHNIIKYLKNHLLLTINLNKINSININNIKIINNFNELDDYHNYYLTITKNNNYIISLCDYNEAIKDGYEFLNISRSIENQLNKQFNGIKSLMFNVVHRDINNDIVKIEFDQPINGFELLIRMIFSSRPFIIINPFLSLNELNYIIKCNYSSTNYLIPKKSISINDIMKKDYLISFPEVSFDTYLDLIEEAINNSLTKMIFITIYRIGSSERIYNLLSKAVHKGITSIVNIELNAYGEKINKIWENKMKQVGIIVLNYGKDDFKIHSKLTLIVFKSNKMIAQIGTGNYHTETTKQYTDLCLFTSDPRICNPALSLIELFWKKNKKFKKNKHFLVTRYNLKNKLIKLIRRETKLKNKGYIGIKCNSFEDEELFEALDKARKAGCRIDLIVRGICTWIPDFNDGNVTIKSIIWDKLEHSRIFWFGKNIQNVYIGSLDPVKRKINNRIELLVEVINPELKLQVMKNFNSYFNDYKYSWYMTNNGEYAKIN